MSRTLVRRAAAPKKSNSAGEKQQRLGFSFVDRRRGDGSLRKEYVDETEAENSSGAAERRDASCSTYRDAGEIGGAVELHSMICICHWRR